jgi:hypothetical protein
MHVGEGVGIYPAAALLTHDCCPNVCHAALAIILHHTCFDHTTLPSPILFISLSPGVLTAPPFTRAPRCPSRQVPLIPLHFSRFYHVLELSHRHLISIDMMMHDDAAAALGTTRPTMTNFCCLQATCSLCPTSIHSGLNKENQKLNCKLLEKRVLSMSYHPLI